MRKILDVIILVVAVVMLAAMAYVTGGPTDFSSECAKKGVFWTFNCPR